MTTAKPGTPVPQGHLRTALKSLRLAALAIAFALPVSLVLFWILLDARGAAALLTLPANAVLSLSHLQRVVCLALSMIPIAILVFGLFRLRKHVAGLLDGGIFSSATAGALRDFAIAIGVSALTKPFVGALVSVALTWSAPRDQRMISFHLSSDTVLSVLFAGTIALAAWTMQQANTVAEENSQFI